MRAIRRFCKLAPRNELVRPEGGTDLSSKMPEFEGEEKFEEALTHMNEFELTHPESLKDLSRVIDETNKQLELKFRRQHKYSLQKH